MAIQYKTHEELMTASDEVLHTVVGSENMTIIKSTVEKGTSPSKKLGNGKKS